MRRFENPRKVGGFILVTVLLLQVMVCLLLLAALDIAESRQALVAAFEKNQREQK